MNGIQNIPFGRIDLLTFAFFFLAFIIILKELGFFNTWIFREAKKIVNLPMMPVSEHAAHIDLIKTMYEKSVMGWVAIDAKGKVILWSPRVEYKFGYSAKEAMGKRLTELIIPPEYAEMHRKGFDKFIQTGKSDIVGNKFGIELEAITKTKVRIPIRLWLFEMSENGIMKVAGFISDRTEELAKENVLKEKIKFLECEEEIGGIGYWYWDLIGKDVWPSKNFRELFNIDPTKKITSDDLMELVYPDDREKTARVINKARDEKTNYEVTYRRLQRDGKIIWILCKGVIASFMPYGDVEAYHGIIQQIDDE